MCRSIQQLRGPDQVAEAEVRAAALQFVRKVSGYRAPSRANAAAFERAASETTFLGMLSVGDGDRCTESLRRFAKVARIRSEKAILRLGQVLPPVLLASNGILVGATYILAFLSIFTIERAFFVPFDASAMF